MASFTLRPNFASGVGHYSAVGEAKFVKAVCRSCVGTKYLNRVRNCAGVSRWQFSAQRDRAPAARSTVVGMDGVAKERVHNGRVERSRFRNRFQQRFLAIVEEVVVKR